MPVFINNVDDYLGPSQACVNPLFAAPPPKKKESNQTNAHLVSKDDKVNVSNYDTTQSTTTAEKAVQNRRIRQRRKPRIIKCEDDDDNKTSATVSKQSAVIRLDNNNESTAPTNVIDTTTTQQKQQTIQTIKKKATVSLSDCLSCSGCVTSAEAVLLDHHSIDKLREIVNDDSAANDDSQLKKEKRRKIAFAISSASLADLYRHLYLENDTSSVESSNDMTDESLPTTSEESTIVIPTRQEFLTNITSFLKSEFNATIVVDGTQHISLMESASEFCYRYKKTKQSKEEDCKMDVDEEAVTSKKKQVIDDSISSVALSSTKTRYINKQQSNDDSVMKDNDDDTLMEITTLSHLPGRIIEEDKSDVSSNTAVSPPIQSTSLPMLASSCPGFVCLVEKTAPTVVPLLSSAKSPMTVAGILLKTSSNTSGASESDDVYHVAIMPCHDKKLEAGRGDFVWERQTLLQVSSMDSKPTPDGGETEDTVNEVDLVLTTGELLEIVNDVVTKQQHTDKGDYTPSTSDIRTFLSTKKETSAVATTAVSFNSNTTSLNEKMNNLELDTGVHGSGSYADYIFRHAAQDLFGYQIPTDKPLPWKSSSSTYTATSTAGSKTTGVIRRRRRRQETTDLREVTLYEHSDGSYSCSDRSNESDFVLSSKPVLRFATAYGFKNVQLILQSLSKTVKSSSSSSQYDYVEVMACPSGCSNGGGQIGANGNRETPKETKERVRKTVSTVPILHPNTSTCDKSLAESLCDCKNQQQGLFNDSIIKSKCFDKKSRQLFHTRFHVVPKLELSTGATAGVAVNDTQW